MKVKMMIAAAAAVGFAAPALADDAMAAYFGNTAEVTYADGSVVSWYFDEDGSVSNNADIAGTWELNGADLCLTLGEEEEARCSSVGEDVRSVGDSFSISLSDGSEATVNIVAGRD